MLLKGRDTSLTGVEQFFEENEIVDEISTTIAAAVEEQSAATSEIARNIDQASSGTNEVSSSIGTISQSVGETGTAASQVLVASSELAEKGESMRSEVSNFLTEVRKAI